MATTIAEPVVRLDMNNARFIKGIASTKNAYRSLWRGLIRTSRSGTAQTGKSFLSLANVIKFTFIGIASFISVRVIASIVNSFRDGFRIITDTVIKGGAEIEDGLVEVNKAANLTGKQIESLRNNFLDFSDQTPITTKQLLKIAAAGARMGLTLDEAGNTVGDAVKRLTDFSRVVAKADVAIEELGTEQLATGLGKLLTLFQLTTDETANLASALNSAAQSANTTADQILNATTRSAGIAKQFGLTAAEAIAINTTMLELGRTAEITGTSFERIFGIIAKPNKFPEFAKLVGRTEEEFGDLFDKNPVKGIREIFKALGQFENAREAEGVLTKLFGTQVRLAGSLRALSQGTKLLDKNLKVATTEFERGKSIEEEFALAAGTVTSKFKTLSNLFSNVGKRVFPLIREALVEAIETFTEFGEELKGITNETTFLEFIKDLIKDLSLLGVSFGRLLFKFVKVFFKEFQQGPDVGFIKGITKLVDDLTDSIRPDTIAAFVDGIKLGLSFVKSLIGAFIDVSRVILESVGAVDRFVDKFSGAQTAFGLMFDAAVKLKTILLDLFSFDESRIRALRDTFAALADFIQVKFANALFGGLDSAVNAAEVRLGRAIERLTKVKEEKPKKQEVKKEAKDKKKEETKEEIKEVAKRKPGRIIVESQLANEILRDIRKSTNEVVRSGNRGNELFKRFNELLEQQADKTAEEFAKTGIRGAKVERGLAPGSRKLAEDISDVEFERQEELEARKKARELQKKSAEQIEEAANNLDTAAALLFSSKRLNQNSKRVVDSLAGTGKRSARQ